MSNFLFLIKEKRKSSCRALTPCAEADSSFACLRTVIPVWADQQMSAIRDLPVCWVRATPCLCNTSLAHVIMDIESKEAACFCSSFFSWFISLLCVHHFYVWYISIRCWCCIRSAHSGVPVFQQIHVFVAMALLLGHSI